MISILCLLVGFALLVWGADFFVASASTLAKRLGVSALIIGLTVVAFGTSAPELTVSVTAGLNQSNEIAISNVLGSNMFNLLMVVGISALITPLVTDKTLLRRDWPLSVVAALALAAMITFDGVLSRVDGLVLLVGFVCVIGTQIRAGKKERALSQGQAADADAAPTSADKSSMPLLLGSIVISLLAIAAGGQLTVNGATGIARMAGLTETVIGLTVVAIGTSLPELVTSIMAARRGENDIALGNVIGSNLFNILLILGTSAAITPIAVESTAVMDIIILLVVSVLLFIPAYKNKFNRGVGVLAVLSYVAYTAYILVR